MCVSLHTLEEIREIMALIMRETRSTIERSGGTSGAVGATVRLSRWEFLNPCISYVHAYV
jgi:hypothetical protein